MLDIIENAIIKISIITASFILDVEYTVTRFLEHFRTQP